MLEHDMCWVKMVTCKIEAELKNNYAFYLRVVGTEKQIISSIFAQHKIMYKQVFIQSNEINGENLATKIK